MAMGVGIGPDQGMGTGAGQIGTQVTATIPAMMPGQIVSLRSGDNVVHVTAPGTIVQTGGSHTIISHQGGMTVDATGGNSVIYGGTDGDLVHEGPDCMFVGAPNGGVSTLDASPGGSDTIFAVTGMVYHGEHGARSLFVGGNAAVTVACAADQTLFAGTGGGIYTVGANHLFFAGGGGADTIVGSAASCNLWTHDRERLTLMTASASGPGAQIVAFGNDDDINMMNANGHNSVILWNAQIGSGSSGFGFTGNTTLTASNAGGDVFALFSGAQFGMPSNGPHTITISNWQASDTLDLTFAHNSAGGFLAGYTAADAASAQAQLAAGNSFTLPDGTTVVFQGARPGTIAHV